jgi:hypothetical protein
MEDREEKIQVRAYEIWERQVRTGAPEDHWLEAERELKAEEPTDITSDRSEATVEKAPPAAAVETLEAASDDTATGKQLPEMSQG